MEGIYKKLLAVQAELKAPKGQRNNFGNYNYRSCEDILEAVKPILKKNDATLYLDDAAVTVGDRVYIMATATFTDGEGFIRTSAYAREEETKKGMDASQITGAASSYARKYALNGLFCIDDTKDSDATNTHETEDEKPPVCEKCGKKLVPYMSDGKEVSIQKHCSGSVRKFGQILCIDCINESKNS